MRPIEDKEDAMEEKKVTIKITFDPVKEKEICDFLLDIPVKHRAWELKKILLSHFKPKVKLQDF